MEHVQKQILPFCEKVEMPYLDTSACIVVVTVFALLGAFGSWCISSQSHNACRAVRFTLCYLSMQNVSVDQTISSIMAAFVAHANIYHLG